MRSSGMQWVGAFALGMAMGACAHTTTGPACGSAPKFDLRAASDAGWRSKIQSNLQGMPDSTQLIVAFWFDVEPFEAERAFVRSIGGRPDSYRFQGIPVVSGTIGAGDLRTFVGSSDVGHVVNIELALPEHVAACR